jgi:hypothetical protein
MRNSFLERQEARSREVREGKNGGRFTEDGKYSSFKRS